jgi:hypothetical protein
MLRGVDGSRKDQATSKMTTAYKARKETWSDVSRPR